MSAPLLKALRLVATHPAHGVRGSRQRKYLVGAMGGLRVLIFDRHDAPEDGPHATMFVAERPPRQERNDEPQARDN